MLDFGSHWSRRSISYFSTWRRQLTLLAAVFFTLLLLFSWHNPAVVRYVVPATPPPFKESGASRCAQLPGADDVLVIMKTGANEVQDKLAVHLRTTLTCYPSHIIFSDYEEDLPSGQHLFDAFKYTSQSLKDNHRDFALWRKLQAEGRAGISPSEQSGTDSRYKEEDIRKTIPGWQLDKWKFLPMVNRTLELHPDKHWYVFVEADTYLMWSNLLPYLAQRSWTDDQYIGSRAIIEELGFAHGGSGFVLSRPALEKVATLFQKEQQHWEEFNNRYWVGDHILAAALREAGVHLTDGRPSWQGEPLSLSTFSPHPHKDFKNLWCAPALTFHHELPSEIEAMWDLEQDLVSAEVRPDGPYRHRDLLVHWILPHIQRPLSGWDNHAHGPGHPDVHSLSDCETICEHDAGCLQYALHSDGTCSTLAEIVHGEPSEGVQSGWMTQRISDLLESQTC